MDPSSSYQDIHVLQIPLISKDLSSASLAKNSGTAGNSKTPSTVRILKFGFGKNASNSWNWDPLKSLREFTAVTSGLNLLRCVLPSLDWIQDYKPSYLRGDFLAGLSVGFMLIPQGMAYARIAGLPAVYGLYTGWMPSIMYAFFGSSRQLALGPTSLVSLLVGEAVKKVAGVEEVTESDPTFHLYLGLTFLLSLMVGCVQIFGGMVRLGWTVRFLSHAVVSGFSSGAAIIIGLTQMRYLLGYRYPRSDKIHILIRDILLNVDKIDYPSLTMGIAAIVFLLVMKHFGKTYKRLVFMRTLGPIVAVLLGVLVIYITQNPWNIRVSGKIPSGTPQLFLDFPFSYWKDMLVPSLVIGGAAYLESVGMAKALAAKNGYSIDANQELFGLGVANVFGACFSAYPTGGSFSRTVVNNECGAKTGLAGIVAAMLICCALMFFTPLFELLPLPVLGAIVMSSVVGLVDHDEAFFLFRVDKKEFCVWLLAFFGTLFFGIQVGIFVAVLISLGFVIDESANPQCSTLGRLPGTTVYRNIEQYEDAKTTPGVVAVRFHSPLYFANVSSIQETLRRYYSDRYTESQEQSVQFVVIDMTPVSSVDSAACQALTEIFHEYQSRGIRMAFANPNHTVMRTFEVCRLAELIGREWFFVRVYDAVLVCKAAMSRANTSPVDFNQDLTPVPSLARRGFEPPLEVDGLRNDAVSVPIDIRHNRSPPRSSDSDEVESSRSAPKVMQSHHVLYDSLNSEVFGDSPSARVCQFCKGLNCEDGSTPGKPKYVLLGKCKCDCK